MIRELSNITKKQINLCITHKRKKERHNAFFPFHFELPYQYIHLYEIEDIREKNLLCKKKKLSAIILNTKNQQRHFILLLSVKYLLQESELHLLHIKIPSQRT